MLEHRTHSLSRDLMLNEVHELCAKLTQAGVKRVFVSFGWDSNLPIEDMWKEVDVAVESLLDYLAESERVGIIQVGKADIFIESEGMKFTLCHESDLHVAGSAPFVIETQRRWVNLGYEPYSVEARV